jgi:hypothetical protein
VKDNKEIVFGHLPKVEEEEAPEYLKNIPQSEKWLYALCKAPQWKKAEYAAQAAAWEDEENMEIVMKWLSGMCKPPKIIDEKIYRCWCCPEGRA